MELKEVVLSNDPLPHKGVLLHDSPQLALIVPARNNESSDTLRTWT